MGRNGLRESLLEVHTNGFLVDMHLGRGNTLVYSLIYTIIKINITNEKKKKQLNPAYRPRRYFI